VVIIFAFLDLEKNSSFSDSLLGFYQADLFSLQSPYDDLNDSFFDCFPGARGLLYDANLFRLDLNFMNPLNRHDFFYNLGPDDAERFQGFLPRLVQGLSKLFDARGGDFPGCQD